MFSFQKSVKFKTVQTKSRLFKKRHTFHSNFIILDRTPAMAARRGNIAVLFVFTVMVVSYIIMTRVRSQISISIDL